MNPVASGAGTVPEKPNPKSVSAFDDFGGIALCWHDVEENAGILERGTFNRASVRFSESLNGCLFVSAFIEREIPCVFEEI